MEVEILMGEFKKIAPTEKSLPSHSYFFAPFFSVFICLAIFVKYELLLEILVFSIFIFGLFHVALSCEIYLSICGTFPPASLEDFLGGRISFSFLFDASPRLEGACLF